MFFGGKWPKEKERELSQKADVPREWSALQREMGVAGPKINILYPTGKEGHI